MQLEEKTVLVTGAGSGLGLATARRLVDEGASVMMFDRDAERVEVVSRELGARALWYSGDIGSESDVQAAIESTLAAFGALHINVNCAGVAQAGKTLGRDGAMPLADFKRIVDINLTGTFNVLRLCAQVMRDNAGEEGDQERGVIINVASAAAYEGQIGQAAYSASKGGIAAMTLPVARDLAGHGIRMMTIAPGIFATPLMKAMPDEIQNALVDMIQFPKRMGLPDEFADMAVQIIRCRYLNGEVIRLDGGLRMAAR